MKFFAVMMCARQEWCFHVKNTTRGRHIQWPIRVFTAMIPYGSSAVNFSTPRIWDVTLQPVVEFEKGRMSKR